MPERFEVAIAGAGVAGLATALAFRKTGAKVTILEQARAFAPVGAGILLQANGLMVLDALGLGDQVRAQGTAMPRFLLRNSCGRCLASTEMNAHLPPRYWPVCIHRARLHDILWQACVGARVTTHLGCKVKSVETNEAGCVSADLRNSRRDHIGFGQSHRRRGWRQIGSTRGGRNLHSSLAGRGRQCSRSCAVFGSSRLPRRIFKRGGGLRHAAHGARRNVLVLGRRQSNGRRRDKARVRWLERRCVPTISPDASHFISVQQLG